MKLVFFIYFLIKSDYKQVINSLRCIKSRNKLLKFILDSLFCSLKYGTSLDDYFNFRFYQKSSTKRLEFATTAYMYNFHRTLNHNEYIALIDDKSLFRLHFKRFSGPSEVFAKNEHIKFLTWLDINNFNEFVIKDPLGTVGKSVKFFTFDANRKRIYDSSNVIEFAALFHEFSRNGHLYVEPRINQHTLIQKLAPSALNTIRVITVLRKDGKVDIISAAFRISVDNATDNFSTGNLAATVDIETGLVITPGIKRMAACSDVYANHPVTGIQILGFKIPHWPEVIKLVSDASLVIPQVRTVGWDVAILEDKPIIIEGNPSWNKGAPQIPSDKGIKPLLDKYLGKNGL